MVTLTLSDGEKVRVVPRGEGLEIEGEYIEFKTPEDVASLVFAIGKVCPGTVKVE